MWGEERGEFEEDWLAWETRSVVVLVTKMGTRRRGGTGEDELWFSHHSVSSWKAQPMALSFISLPLGSGPSRAP